MNLRDLIVSLEKSLHAEQVRHSKTKLACLLHDEFMEIGASGRIFDKKKIIKNLSSEESYNVLASDFEFVQLSPEIVQLRYKSVSTKRNNVTRHTLRSSIWKINGTSWQILFHQGTIVEKT